MNNDNTDFDVEQCERDDWQCEVMTPVGWMTAEYLGINRDGSLNVNGAFPSFKVTQNGIRNIPKKKPMRWTRLVRGVSLPLEANSPWAVEVPMTINQQGQPIVDHSDAIIKVLDNVLDAYANLENPLFVLVRNEIDRIKKERGDL